jgi:hypothetical protein
VSHFEGNYAIEKLASYAKKLDKISREKFNETWDSLIFSIIIKAVGIVSFYNQSCSFSLN